MTAPLFLHLKATPLEFDAFAGEESTYGPGIQGSVPTTRGGPARYTARLDERTASVVLRMGEARPVSLQVRLADLLTAWLVAEDRVADLRPEHQPDYTRSLLTR